jgi:hypothetical protein
MNYLSYSESDLQRYYLDTYVVCKSYNLFCKVLSISSEGATLLRNGLRAKYPLDVLFELYDMTVAPLGYFVDQLDRVGYLSYYPSRSSKKAVYLPNTGVFVPQADELAMLGESFNKDLSKCSQTITPLADVQSVLEDHKACIIHKNFAIVYKGWSQHPVVYFKTQPVCLFVDGEFTPIEGQDALFVEKILLELEA